MKVLKMDAFEFERNFNKSSGFTMI